MSLIERLLGRSVAKELKDHGRNMRFWGLGIDTPPVENGEDGINIIDASRLSSLLTPDSNLRTQAGIAWEFVWGTPPPKNIGAERNKLLTKARTGKKLTHEEQIWLNLIQAGTDSF